MGAIVMNIASNMLGLGNAATPLGLRAMQRLERINPHPGVASDAMCTFLAINTSSIQLIPATAVGILAAAGSANPTAIIGTSLIATTCSCRDRHRCCQNPPAPPRLCHHRGARCIARPGGFSRG